MRKFFLGVVLTFIVLALLLFLLAITGVLSLTADQRPGKIESYIASGLLDTNMEHVAPRVSSPVQPTDANLVDGMRFYVMNCAVCHGGMDKKVAGLGRAFYPPAPQLIIHPLDDPEWHIFYAIKHGIRWTGMPAWGKTTSDEEIWKVTMFLSRAENLPPGVQQLIGK